MSLLNLLDCKQKHRKLNKSDLEYLNKKSQLSESHTSIKSLLDSKLEFESIQLSEMQKELRKDFKSELDHLNQLRKLALSSSMLLPKELVRPVVISTDVNDYSFDIISAIASAPRIKADKIKEVADKLNYCIFDEKVFNEENKSSNSEAASEMAELLRESGYKIYYLSPLSAFDYGSFVKSGSGIYDIDSYWGNHFQTFNTLALSVNVFRDIYSQIDALKEENESIRNAIKDDRNRLTQFHNQFKNYVNHMQKNLSILERPLNQLINDQNEKMKKDFKASKSHAIAHNAKHPNRYSTHEYYDYYEKDPSTGEYVKSTMYDIYDTDNDYKMFRRTMTIDNWLPIPSEPKYYEKYYSEKFNVQNLSSEKELKAFEKSYNIVNIKELLLSELSDNYLMLASKENISESSSDVIVLSSWGKGFSEESLVALGVK